MSGVNYLYIMWTAFMWKISNMENCVYYLEFMIVHISNTVIVKSIILLTFVGLIW